MKYVLLTVCAVALMMPSMVLANVLVSYNGNSLGLFSDSGELIRNYATDMSNPQGVVTDNAGNVYVADWGHGQVRMYEMMSGAFVRNVVVNAACRPIGLAFNPANPGEIIVILAYDTGGGNFTKSQLARWNTNATNSSVIANNNLGVPYSSAYYFPGIPARNWAAGIYVAAAGIVFQKFSPATLAHIPSGDLSAPGAGAITGAAADLYLTGTTTGLNGYLQRVSDSAVLAQGMTSPTGITNDGTNLWVAQNGNNAVANYDAATGALISYFNIPAPMGIAYICAWPVGDLNFDCTVDFADFAMMAAEWLECTRIPPSLCD